MDLFYSNKNSIVIKKYHFFIGTKIFTYFLNQKIFGKFQNEITKDKERIFYNFTTSKIKEYLLLDIIDYLEKGDFINNLSILDVLLYEGNYFLFKKYKYKIIDSIEISYNSVSFMTLNELTRVVSLNNLTLYDKSIAIILIIEKLNIKLRYTKSKDLLFLIMNLSIFLNEFLNCDLANEIFFTELVKDDISDKIKKILLELTNIIVLRVKTIKITSKKQKLLFIKEVNSFIVKNTATIENKEKIMYLIKLQSKVNKLL